MKKLCMILIMIFLLTGCSKNEEVIKDSNIKFGIVKDTSKVPFIFGSDSGIYYDNGLDLELVYFNNEDEMQYAFDNNMIDIMQKFNGENNLSNDIYSSTARIFKIISNKYVKAEFDDNMSMLSGSEVGIIREKNTIEMINFIEKNYNIELRVKEYDTLLEMDDDFKSGELGFMLVGDYFPLSNKFYDEKTIWSSEKDNTYYNYIIVNENFKNENSLNNFFKISNKIISETAIEDYRQIVLIHDILDPTEYYDNMPIEYNQIGKKIER